MKKAHLLALLIAAVTVVSVQGAEQTFTISEYLPVINLNDQPVWKITQGDNREFSNPKYDDSNWTTVALPLKEGSYVFSGNPDDIYWYRMKFTLPDDTPEHTLGIKLGKLCDIDETYLNGVKIGGTGSFDGGRRGHAFNQVRYYELPQKYLRFGKENVISIRVKNTYRNDELPGRGDYAIGYIKNFMASFYFFGFVSLAFSVVYIMLGGFFLIMYVRRSREKENLFFSAFTLMLAIYSFTRTDIKYIFTNNFILLQKLEFGSLYLMLPLFMTFIILFFKRSHHIIHYVFYGLSAIFFGILVFLPEHMQWYTMNVRAAQWTWPIPVATWIWILATEFRRNREARIMLYSSVIIISGIVHDIMLSRGTQIFSDINFWISPFTFFLYVLSIAAILSGRFANLLNEVEDLNLNLEKKVDQRTAELHDAMDEIKIRDEKIHKELQIAGRVQEKLMPEILPEWNCFRVVVNYVPLREVSGDFFDVFEFSDGDHGLMLGDASGHGVPAAIYTIMARNALQRAKYVTSSPAEIFKRTNAELCNLDTGQYMTAFMVKFNKSTLHYTNAGHPKALFLSVKRRSIRQLDTSGTFIGAMIDAADTFSDASIAFEEGDKVIIYTDCLTEGNNVENEEFGEKRLIDLLKKHFFMDIEDLLDTVLNEFYAFTEGQERKDDLTLIGLEYTGE